MKLMNLIEEDGQGPIETYNRFTKVLNDFATSKGNRIDVYSYPEGKYGLDYFLKFDPAKHLGESYGRIEVSIYFYPNMDNPTLPLDMLRKPFDLFIANLKEFEPKLVNDPNLYPEDLLNKIDVGIHGYYVRCGNVLYNTNELLGRAMYNIKIKGFLEPLGEMLLDPGKTEQYMFAPIELPEFGEDFKKIHDDKIKRSKTIVKAHQKGKWRGHTYEIGTLDGKYNTILLLTDHNKPAVVDGVIQPTLVPHLSMMSPIIDGYSRWNDSDKYPLSDDEVREFEEHMDKVFGKYGIKYR